jgi:NAD(P)-dependent dehydrogenase (short-subunit alcohol dehydrogenase family)
MTHIANTVAFVTGANRGIGRAFVDELLARGARRVYAGTRHPASIDALAQLDPRVQPIVLDVRSATDVENAARSASDVTLLINNAGTLSLGGPSTVPVSAIRDDMETNFFGTLNVINAFVPALEQNG